MEKRHISDTENRLLLLAALQALGPVTEAELLRFISELDLMSWLELQLSMAALIDDAQILRRPHPLATLLLISADGEFTLETFRHKIPASRREAIAAGAQVWQSRFRAEQDTPTESFRLSDGRQSIRLRLLQDGNALFDLMMILPPDERLHALDARWQRSAQAIYASVLETLSTGYTGAESTADLPATAALQALREDEWLLSLTDRTVDPQFTLLLSVPDAQLARHFATRWQQESATMTVWIAEKLKAETP